MLSQLWQWKDDKAGLLARRDDEVLRIMPSSVAVLNTEKAIY